MFSFFTSKKWWGWSILGTAAILFSTWYQVQLDVKINEWFGDFYDMLQGALAEPNSVTLEDFMGQLFTFGEVAGLWVVIAVVTLFFTSHWIFRWRTAMTEHYQSIWSQSNGIEGASQRVQEDTLKFARLMESLGVGILEACMVLFAFVPILYTLSENITSIPVFGEVEHSLVWVAIVTALGGTVLLALIGSRLPGIEYDIQKEEAGYRKALVLDEGKGEANPSELNQLYNGVRKIHFRSYFHYAYFNVSKFSYLQGMVLVPYLAMGPSIVSGALTLGLLQQIARAFGKVAESLQFLVRSWDRIVELMSVYKRLREFEKRATHSDAQAVLAP